MAYSALVDRDLKPRDSDLALVLGDSRDLWTEVREDLLAVQDEMSTLTERLDFTEKLLMRGGDSTETGD